MLLLQLAAVLAVCRVVTQALARLRQPAVVAQIVAGVVIGPSVLGLLEPWRLWVLPPGSTPLIRELGNLGLVLYLFAVGSELDLDLLRRHARATAAISVTSVVLPLAAGVAAGLWLARDPRLFPPGVDRGVAVGFFALAISITALPVMAGILAELRLTGSRMGTTSLAAGSFNGLVAWCLLAGITGSMGNRAPAIAATVLGLLALLVLARRTRAADLLAGGLEEWAERPWLPPAVLLAVLLASWACVASGLHPAFGAFIAGMAMPRTEAMLVIRRRLVPVVTAVLLPLFFVYAGLETRIGLLLTGDLPLIAGLVVLVACASKWAGCWLAARATGHSGRESAGIGALMNARGLVELVVLTVGLQEGVITPTLFSILVLMAIVTTMMTGPIVGLLYPGGMARGDVARAAAEVGAEGR